MNEQQQDHGLKYSGTVYARRIGEEHFWEVGNTTSLKLKSGVDKDERISKKKENWGQALDADVRPKPTEMTMELDTFNKRNFGMMLMGEAAELASTPQTVTDAAYTVKKGVQIKLAHEQIDLASVKIKPDTGTGTVDAKEYTVNASLGMITIHADSTLVDGDAIKITYKTTGKGGFIIDAATLSRLDLEIMLDGKNRITGKEGVLKIYHSVLSSDGEFDWLGDDWATAAFSGTCTTPAGKASAYQFQEYDQ